MPARVTALLLLLIATASVLAEEPSSEFVVAGYLPSYRLPAWNEDQLGPVNHLIYFHAIPDKDGSLPDAVLSRNVRERLASIKKTRSLRISLTIGGWGHSERLVDVCGSDEKRTRLVGELRDVTRETAVDSIDFDWEHPETPSQWADYIALVRESKSAIRSRGGICTVALAPWNEPPPDLWAVADRIHLMSYDHAYPHATFEKTRADVERVLSWGCPREKLLVGIPFYGRANDWKATSYAKLIANDDLDATDASLSGVAFNNRATVRRKVHYAMQNRLAGVMIWELAQDTTDDSTSLLKVIEQSLAD